MGTNPSQFKGPDLPVDNIGRDDCQEFIRRLNRRPDERSGVYRLPTEAEWEYACRAGSTASYSFGDSVIGLRDYAWYIANSGDMTHVVGTRPPNAWGLRDMHGNVGEWCQDWYHPDYYAVSPRDNPQGPPSGLSRIIRGGSWGNNSCRSARRDWNHPGRRHFHDGFRLARTVSSPSR